MAGFVNGNARSLSKKAVSYRRMDLPFQTKRILVVEDNPEMRLSVANTLRLERYQVDQADHGQAALTLMQRVTPDLILSDINMPRMGGIEFYRVLRQNPRWLL